MKQEKYVQLTGLVAVFALFLTILLHERSLTFLGNSYFIFKHMDYKAIGK